MLNFDDFINALKEEIIELAKYSWNEHKNSAISDGNSFVDKCKVDLERWTRLLARGELTPDDFEWLVNSKRDLAELVALKQIGLSKVALDRFVNGVIDTIIATAFKSFA